MCWVLLVIFSLAVGSFLNVVIFRVPKILEAQVKDKTSGFNLCFPRSHCTSCKKSLKWWQNIPLLSYIIQGAKCSYCNNIISWQYPFVEFAAIAVAVIGVFVFGWTISAAGVVLASWFLICLFFIDARTQLLPDCLTLPLLWLGLLFNLDGHFAPLKSAVIGAVLGYLVLWIIFYGFKLVTKKDGMGFGDFKLLAALGAWLGWMAVPVVLFFSAVLTLVFFAFMNIAGKASKDMPIAFGPALCIIGFIFFYFGHDIMHYWLGDFIRLYE